MIEPTIGSKWNWPNQEELLMYLGKQGAWHQFAKVNEPLNVWCEVPEHELCNLEQTTGMELVKSNAIASAHEIVSPFSKWNRLRNTIARNPYDRKNRKKEHVVWHNEFRKERLLMDRRLM